MSHTGLIDGVDARGETALDSRPHPPRLAGEGCSVAADQESSHRRAANPDITVIECRRRWRTLDVGELWSYRELLWVLMFRDVKVRYKQTVLGSAWAVLKPLLATLIFSVVFGRLAKLPSDGIPYPLFVYAALLPWTFFANSVSASGQSLVGSAQLVSKVYFPRLIIPLSSIGAGLVDLLVSTAILLVMMVWYGVDWSVHIFAAPLLVLWAFLTALGVGALLSALTVAYRDFTHITPFLVQLWMYATPVVFPIALVPEKWRWAFYVNPMTGVVEGFRSAFLGRPFDYWGLALSFLVSVVVFVVAAAHFDRVEHRFADII